MLGPRSVQAQHQSNVELGEVKAEHHAGTVLQRPLFDFVGGAGQGWGAGGLGGRDRGGIKNDTSMAPKSVRQNPHDPLLNEHLRQDNE